MTLKLNLQSDSFIDFAFGTVTEGKEMQVFQEYFPAVAPAIQEFGLQPLRPFAVLATNAAGPKPKQGNLTYVPSVESFANLHLDDRFLKARPIRDAAMDFLTGGNLFESIDQQITVDSETDYALVIANKADTASSTLFELNLTEGSPNQLYKGKSLSLRLWSDKIEALLLANEATVFRIRFFPENG